MTAGPADADLLEVNCRIDIERTERSLHAIVELDLAEIWPGDEVRLLGAPLAVASGERLIAQGIAAVTRASRWRRMLVRLSSYRDLFELFEVGFSAGRVR